MAKHPEEFEHIKSLILLQPVSGSYIIEEFVKANNIPHGTSDSTRRSVKGPASTSPSNRRSSTPSRSVSLPSSLKFMTTR